jgi:hypothetical protein
VNRFGVPAQSLASTSVMIVRSALRVEGGMAESEDGRTLRAAIVARMAPFMERIEKHGWVS